MTARMAMALPAAVLAVAIVASHAQAGPKEDQLLQAVRARNAAAVKGLVARGADPNFRFHDNSTALSWAVDRIDPDSVRALLAAGARPNAAPDGLNPLVLACEGGDAGVIGELLEARSEVKVARFDGVTPLHLCARTAPSQVVKRLVDAGAVVEALNVEGQTPLMFAAAAGRADNIAVLINAGAKVNQVTGKGFTPLFFAVHSKSEEAVKALLQAGASVRYAATDGNTALHLALYDHDVPIATMLVERGAALDGWDEIGRTPLQAAVAEGDAALVKLMLSKGADPSGLSRLPYRLDPTMDNSNDGSKVRPRQRDFAALGYTPKIMLSKVDGAAPVAEPAEPTTPLILAAARGYEEIMKLLVAAGAKPAFRTADGNDIVLAAAGSGKLTAVQYAAALHPLLDGVRADGSTVIHVALTSRAPETPEIIRFLADKGAPLDVKNKRGLTAADIAERGSPAMKAMFAEVLKTHNVRRPTSVAAGS
jgi:ankyrin repeat protein